MVAVLRKYVLQSGTGYLNELAEINDKLGNVFNLYFSGFMLKTALLHTQLIVFISRYVLYSRKIRATSAFEDWALLWTDQILFNSFTGQYLSTISLLNY